MKAKAALPSWASPNFNQPDKGKGTPVKMNKTGQTQFKRHVTTSIMGGAGAKNYIKVR
jgi:hypothetical protein